MSRVDYQMSPADLRAFGRWHSRGAAILLAALVLMPWMIGIGPNSARHEAAQATASNESAALAREPEPPTPATATAAIADTAAATSTVAAAPTAPDAATTEGARR
jgi:hypothetical protein